MITITELSTESSEQQNHHYESVSVSTSPIQLVNQNSNIIHNEIGFFLSCRSPSPFRSFPIVKKFDHQIDNHQTHQNQHIKQTNLKLDCIFDIFR